MKTRNRPRGEPCNIEDVGCLPDEHCHEEGDSLASFSAFKIFCFYVCMRETREGR